MGITRDFSRSSIAEIREIIRKNVDEEDQWAIVDWFYDITNDDVDIHGYMNNVSEYQAKMVDKHNISSSKFDEILAKVQTVDYNYAGRTSSLYQELMAFYNKIVGISALLSTNVVEMNSDEYKEYFQKINTKYDKIVSDTDETLEAYKKSMPRLDDPAWYEKALNAAGGFVVSMVTDTCEGVAYVMGTPSILWGGYDDYVNGINEAFDFADQMVVTYLVTDEESYYFGRTAGDVTMTVVGTVKMASGLSTLATGLAGETGGMALDMTGVGAVVGVPVQVVSTAAVVEGVLVTAEGACICAASMNNYDNNLQKMRDAQQIERPNDNQLKDPNEIKTETSGDIQDKVKGIDKNKYTGGRTAEEIDDLAKDPSHGNRVEVQGMKEREVGLALEERGDLGHIVRDPQIDKGAEFIDQSSGVKWDVKSFESYPSGDNGVPITDPRKGAFSVKNAMKKITKEFNNGHNVIVDTRNMTSEHIMQLKQALEAEGTISRIIWYP